MLAWHFLPEGRRLRWGTSEEVKPGQKLTVEPPLRMCYHGLHASVRAIDAIRYAPGPIVCRVELSGEIIEDRDKVCATERTCLWMADATRTLHEFAIWCAEGALNGERKAGREPDPKSWAAIQAKRDWLDGKITDDQMDDARDAAEAADRAAAWTAAVAAAWTASRAASRTAAEATARAASRAAARTAAEAVAFAKQNQKLTDMLFTLML